MKQFASFITWLTGQTIVLYRFIGGMTVGIMFGIPTLFLFGDTLLSLLGHGLTVLGHGLHLLFEVFEAIAGHFLEWAFHLSKKAAEIIIFWSSLGLALGLSWTLSRKAHSAARHAVKTVQERRLALVEATKIITWIRFALIISSLSATLYLFT
jgi:hypothetical protein